MAISVYKTQDHKSKRDFIAIVLSSIKSHKIYQLWASAIRVIEKVTLPEKQPLKRLKMSGFPDPQVLQNLTRALACVHIPDQDPTGEGSKWVSQFKSDNPISLWLAYLALCFSDPSQPEAVRTIVAIEIFTTLQKKTKSAQRRFAIEYLKYDIQIREQIRGAAVQNMTSGTNEELVRHSAFLLGMFFALEFTREPVVQEFVESFLEIMSFAEGSPNPNVKMCVYSLFTMFAEKSIELKENCEKDNVLMTHSNRLFELILFGMRDTTFPVVQVAAIDTMCHSLLVFRRTLSFERLKGAFLETVFDLMAMNVPAFVRPLYQLLRRYIDNFYNDLKLFIEKLAEITLTDMMSGVEERQIEACYIWSTIGDVEGDILIEDKRHVKKRHQGYDNCYEYASQQFEALFQILVKLITETDVTETEPSMQPENSVSRAAFTCFLNMTKATGERAVAMILEFVSQFGSAPDWRVRHTSALLLHAGSQMPCFKLQPRYVLLGYEFFVNAISDDVDKISEVAMWSLGIMIEEIPELVTDPSRFAPLVEQVSKKINGSDEITSRCCWLLNCCFGAFSSAEESSPLVTNFDNFAEMLLQAGEKSDVDAQDTAYGALSRLIERTPSSIADAYNRLFAKLTAKLGNLLREDPRLDRSSPKLVQQIIALLALVQAIVMNVGPMIGSIAGDLMAILSQYLQASNNYVCEVLPAMGAVARAIGDAFVPYAKELLPKAFEYLESEEFAYPAAVFIGDVFNSIKGIAPEITEHCIRLLFGALDRFDSMVSQGRLACFTALTAIAKYVGKDCMGWLDKFTEMLEQEARVALNNDDENLDPEAATSFAIECLQIYEILVPILATVDKGDKKVKFFFHIFDKIGKLESVDYTCVLPDVVILLRMIADAFQRRMNVYLNKPRVKSLLKEAAESSDPWLSQVAQETMAYISTF